LEWRRLHLASSRSPTTSKWLIHDSWTLSSSSLTDSFPVACWNHSSEKVTPRVPHRVRVTQNGSKKGMYVIFYCLGCTWSANQCTPLWYSGTWALTWFLQFIDSNPKFSIYIYIYCASSWVNVNCKLIRLIMYEDRVWLLALRTTGLLTMINVIPCGITVKTRFGTKPHIFRMQHIFISFLILGLLSYSYIYI